ncbi:O-antigen ligase domain-containing protein [Azospirillaceae bacterium]
MFDGAFQSLCLLFALALYGGFSAPAPSDIGPTEIAIAAFLTFAVGPRAFIALLSGALLHASPPFLWESIGCLSFHILLWLPLLRGVAMHGDLNAIFRDLAPLLYLFLPLLLGRRLTSSNVLSILAAGMTIAGIAFTLRWWSEAPWALWALGRRPLNDGTQYLLNDPSVLFIAVWLPCWGWERLFFAPTKENTHTYSYFRNILRGLFGLSMIALGGLSILALTGAVHRTAMILGGASCILYLARVGRRAPLLTLGAVGAVLILEQIAPGQPLLGALQHAADKTELVGWNARTAEIEAVLACVTADPISFIIGEGWGALIANPAVGEWRVGYTHSFFSYLLFKTGIVGALATAVWVATLVPVVFRMFQREFLLSLALTPPLLMGMFLHTSFKYLSFGVVLLMIVLIGREGQASYRN